MKRSRRGGVSLKYRAGVPPHARCTALISTCRACVSPPSTERELALELKLYAHGHGFRSDVCQKLLRRHDRITFDSCVLRLLNRQT